MSHHLSPLVSSQVPRCAFVFQPQLCSQSCLGLDPPHFFFFFLIPIFLLSSAKPPNPELQAAKTLPELIRVQADISKKEKHTHTLPSSHVRSINPTRTREQTPLASVTRRWFVCEPSVHLFQRTNTPDSTEEPLSPFHCSLNSTIESTRWRDKLEQKLNATLEGIGDREPLFPSVAISLRIRKVYLLVAVIPHEAIPRRRSGRR